MNQDINIRLLLHGCAKSNPNCQARLYQQFYGFGMNIALRYSKTYSEAEEILNDAFLRIFQNINQYDTAYPFKAWMKKIVVNTAIDYFRKYQKNKIKFSADEIPDIADESEFIYLEEKADMLPIVQALPPMYRMVFNLYVMEGYKHQEIAALLDISVGTSKSNLARAKAKLKLILLQPQPLNTPKNG